MSNKSKLYKSILYVFNISVIVEVVGMPLKDISNSFCYSKQLIILNNIIKTYTSIIIIEFGMKCTDNFIRRGSINMNIRRIL